MKTLSEIRTNLKNDLIEAAGSEAEVKDLAGKLRYNGAKQYLRQHLSEGTFEGDIKEAIESLAGTGKRGGGGAKRTSTKAVEISILVEAGEMTDFECFSKFKKGPAEMRDLMRYGVRDLPEEERVWISFQDDIYKVEHVGPEAPADWDWYMPVKDEMEV